MSGNPTGLSSATTYQAIVIALVAAGIISIGVMSVCYRRRRRDEWERTVRAGIERARFRQGFPETGGDAGIGEKPMLWDVDIGGEGDEWTPIRMGLDPSKRPTMTPHTIAAPGPSEENKSTNVELTILIAMPQPPHHKRPITRNPSFASINLDSESFGLFGLGELPHYKHTPAQNEEEDEIPYMELGTTVVPVTIRTEEEEDAVMGMRLGSRAGIASDWSRGGGLPGR